MTLDETRQAVIDAMAEYCKIRNISPSATVFQRHVDKINDEYDFEILNGRLARYIEFKEQAIMWKLSGDD